VFLKKKSPVKILQKLNQKIHYFGAKPFGTHAFFF